MTHWQRKIIADNVRNRWYAQRVQNPEPEPIIQDVEPIPLEAWFDESLTGIDKHILEELGVAL